MMQLLAVRAQHAILKYPGISTTEAPQKTTGKKQPVSRPSPAVTCWAL